MPTLIPQPTVIEAAGNKPKVIQEFIGRVNSAEGRISVARMRSPGGWVEPGQTRSFTREVTEFGSEPLELTVVCEAP